ncbi:hypothetical protein [Halorientalis regularis]|uniref:Uncharacterized protein n=1 Tax=Halorientalis regularis TaxID=660518 RepID=A0A1G7F835_9EURY|nr:hypothetical protein [Halorientalis regularis]SDE72108.1 hypothetical protein SAMN05216218_10169 [Halorientalis regularis]
MYEFYGYYNDLLVRLHTESLRVADVHRAAAYDDEESHISLPTYVPRVSAMSLTNFLGRRREQSLRGPAYPAWLSYATGLVTGTVGVGPVLAETVADDGTARSVGNRRRSRLSAVSHSCWVRSSDAADSPTGPSWPGHGPSTSTSGSRPTPRRPTVTSPKPRRTERVVSSVVVVSG